jgi:hypothetical protein
MLQIVDATLDGADSTRATGILPVAEFANALATTAQQPPTLSRAARHAFVAKTGRRASPRNRCPTGRGGLSPRERTKIVCTPSRKGG